MDHAELMDRVYRYQRFFYDLTRRFFLPGRDELLRRMEIKPGQAVLEVGCGTARNLLRLAKTCPDVRLYGLDISAQMLQTARKKIGKLPIRLVEGSAEEFDYRRTFGLDRPFDVIFFSYSLSMIPDWRKALWTAMENLQPQGKIYMVDFWDLQGWPCLIRKLLVRWLALFHVRHEPKLIEFLQESAVSGQWKLSLQPILRRYALLAGIFRKNL